MRFMDIRDSVKQPTVITPWSYMHVVSGVWLFALISYAQPVKWGPVSTFVIASLIHACYEAKDMYISYRSPSTTGSSKDSFWGTSGGASWINALGDQACATVGMLLAFKMLGPVCSRSHCLNMTLLATTTYLVFRTNRTNRTNLVWG